MALKAFVMFSHFGNKKEVGKKFLIWNCKFDQKTIQTKNVFKQILRNFYLKHFSSLLTVFKEFSKNKKFTILENFGFNVTWKKL